MSPAEMPALLSFLAGLFLTSLVSVVVFWIIYWSHGSVWSGLAMAIITASVLLLTIFAAIPW